MDNRQKAASALSAAQWRSYTILLRQNKRFRIFWMAGVISQLGNWFNYIAIFVLLNRLTGSGQAVSWFLIAKFLPSAILGPAAGVVTDRFSRKAIMIGCDLLRVGIVLCFLLVSSSRQVWIVYLLALTQESLWSFANPARQASVPNLCNLMELRVANGLSGASWSMLLAIGAALGGFVTALLGWQTAIIIDACTFLISAAMIFGLSFPGEEKSSDNTAAKGWHQLLGIADLQSGYRYVKENREVASLLMVKSGWALSGGILVMLAVFGEQVFPVAGREGAGSGLFYSFRGMGAAVGPILAWRLLGETRKDMYRGISLSFFISALAYLLFSQAPNLFLALPLVLLGHIGGSIQWVFSTTLLQMTVPDIFRGRVFAAETALLTLVLSLSTYLTGMALDAGLSPRMVVAGLASFFFLPGCFWSVVHRKRTTKKKM